MWGLVAIKSTCFSFSHNRPVAGEADGVGQGRSASGFSIPHLPGMQEPRKLTFNQEIILGEPLFSRTPLMA